MQLGPTTLRWRSPGSRGRVGALRTRRRRGPGASVAVADIFCIYNGYSRQAAQPSAPAPVCRPQTRIQPGPQETFLHQDIETWGQAIRTGCRQALTRALTLVESRRPAHRREARALLGALLAETPVQALRLGVSGSPGVGKSTFIDAAGEYWAARGRRVAVLAVDPSSPESGGSILGDKTRMARLASRPEALIRPSPSALVPGGVASSTRETVFLCEAAGFDVVFVETVGVGQGEIEVAGMVDLLLLILEPGAGDDIQGIKRGILEVADFVAVNKADGETAERAANTAASYGSALSIVRGRQAPGVTALSSLRGDGVDGLVEGIDESWRRDRDSGALEKRRRHQHRQWFKALIDRELKARFAEVAGTRLAACEQAVVEGRQSPLAAADELFQLFAFEAGESENTQR